MPAPTTSDAFPTEHIQLYDNCLPALEAGTYQVTITPEVRGVDTAGYLPPAHKSFTVQAPRFTLDPGDIGDMFPPPNSSGDYARVLPTIVLNQRFLPWERLVAADRPAATPWLALLTLGPHDPVPGEGTSPTCLRTSTVEEFLRPSDGVHKPAIDAASVPAGVLGNTVQSIVLPGRTFLDLAPTPDELRYLAHVRRTDTAHQADSGATEDGWYAIVWSNRFPDSAAQADGAGTRNLVCLVSLEGLADALAPGTGLPVKPDGSLFDVQLAVLANWTFVSNPSGGGSFAALAAGLLPGRSAGDGLVPRLPVPPTAPASPAATRLRQGYVPLTFHAPSGEDTFAWYRGPFAPVPATPVPVPPDQGHWASSAQLTIYLPEHGVFDLSYAAAFEIGRSVALADRAFAVALSRARRQTFGRIATLTERLGSGRFDEVPADELLAGNPHHRRFAAHVNAGLAADVHAALSGPPRPRRPPGPRRPGPHDPVTATRDLLARVDVRDTLTDQARNELDPVTDRLAQLTLLHDVPFEHLVPDERLLPSESIRFFHIDRSWVTALLDGALSIAVESSRDALLHSTWRESLHTAAYAKSGRVRALRRQRPELSAGDDGTGPRAQAGLLIRSALVSGWPGVGVTADDGATAVLRMDVLGSDVLLVLFDAVPATVTLSEPWHGLRLGITADADGEEVIELRGSDGAAARPFPARGGISAFLRATSHPGSRRVIDLVRLVAALAAELGRDVGPALLATQLLRAPQQLEFAPPSPSSTRDGENG